MALYRYLLLKSERAISPEGKMAQFGDCSFARDATVSFVVLDFASHDAPRDVCESPVAGTILPDYLRKNMVPLLGRCGVLCGL